MKRGSGPRVEARVTSDGPRALENTEPDSMDAQLYAAFDELEDRHWWFLGRRAIVLAVARRLVEPRGRPRILDVGCGTGGMLAALAELGDVYGIEAEARAVAAARRRVGEEVRVRHGYIPDDLPEGERFDLVTALDVIEHLEDPEAALVGVRRVLVPNGRLIVTVPAFPFLWSGHDEVNGHFRRYTRASLEAELTGAGFEIVHCTYFNSLLFAPTALLRRLGQWRRANGAARSDLFIPPRAVNVLLRELFALERIWVPRLAVPFGVSLLAVARPGRQRYASRFTEKVLD